MSNIIWADTTWEAGSYHEGGVQVADGVTLTIKEGVTVYGAEIVVSGNLIVTGTRSSPVLFDNATITASGARVNVDFASFSNTSSVFNLDSVNKLTVTNSTFIDNYSVFNDNGGYETYNLNNNVFTGNEKVFQRIRLTGNSVISENYFIDNSVIFEGGTFFGTTTIRNNNFINFEELITAPRLGYGYGTVVFDNNFFLRPEFSELASYVYDGSDDVRYSIIQFSPSEYEIGNNLCNVLLGSGGNDTLDGGAGNDTLTGGAGSDTFVFRGTFDHDVITDFDEVEDSLEFYAEDGSSIAVSELIESTDSNGYRVLSTTDGLSSVTLISSIEVESTVIGRGAETLNDVRVSYDFVTPSGQQKTIELPAQAASKVSQAMERGVDLTVTADKSIDEASEEAIGAYDALQALRLAVGLTKSDGTAEWHDYLAADINKDGRVGADDALDILKFAVGLTDGSSADWIFVDGDADWSGIDRRDTSYDEGVMLEDVLVDTSINMTGILLGDLDGSYVA